MQGHAGLRECSGGEKVHVARVMTDRYHRLNRIVTRRDYKVHRFLRN
jgi:hypothetical protein